MKRLKRSSSVESDFLIQWLDDWESISSFSIERIINNNHDCLYSNEAYRVLFLQTNSIGRKISDWNDLIANKEAVDDSVRQNITRDDSYASFSQTIDGSLFFAHNNILYGESAWVLKSNVSGLDLSKLYEKYRDEVERELAYTGYQEVIAKLSDYEIVGCIIDNHIYENYSMLEVQNENGEFNKYVIQID